MADDRHFGAGRVHHSYDTHTSPPADVPCDPMVMNGMSAVLALASLAAFGWLHEKGRSRSIAPSMTALLLTVVSMYMFVLTESRQCPVALWLAVQAIILVATAVVVRWDRRTATNP